jgi:type II secretory pathway component GspD/PulD (secretin)
LADGLGFPWEMMIGYSPNREFTDALSLTLNLLTQNDEATIIASPQVLAQDGKEAEIKVTTEEYFQITSEAGAFLRADLEKIETGTILRITPQVGGDGKLTLDMNIEVSDVVARGKENLPVISRRTARSTVQIESGGTAAIAGLLDSRSQFGKAGVPGASGLPLLGRAFRTDTLNHQARQVAVFVTATSVDPDESRLGSAKVGPHVATVNTEVYRQELQAALDALNVGR